MDDQGRAVGRLRWSNLRLLRKAALSFLLIGPPLGAFGTLLPGLIAKFLGHGWHSVSLSGVLTAVALFTLFVYYWGSMPALVCGLLYGALLLAIGKREPLALPFRLIAGALAGIAASAILSLLWSVIPIFFIAGAIGGAASAACLRKLSCS